MRNEPVNRFPELDGVRGLAILLVVILHIFAIIPPFTQNIFVTYVAEVARIGWIGVDIFFVLSGFLITSILLNTRTHPHYFKNFYARRILRIVPLYFFIVGTVFLFLPVLTPKADMTERNSWPFFLFYLQNWLYIPSFHFASFPLLLAPSWSLAIEEQFYLVWPALVFLLPRRRLADFSMTIFISSFVARFLFWKFGGNLYSSPQFLYFNTFTRFDELSLGALIAIAFQSEKSKRILFNFAWPVLGISLTMFIALMITTGTLAPGDGNADMSISGYSLVALASGALIVIVTAGSQQTFLSIFFRNRVLLFLGKYSYAIYLIHYPVALILADWMKDTNSKGFKYWLIYVFLTFTLSIFGSLLTWHLLEQPMLKLKKYFEYQSVHIKNGARAESEE